MEHTYTGVIKELRMAADVERGVLAVEGMGTESEHVRLLEAAADAIETLSGSIETYAKANAELTAWKNNAQEWMQKVAEEKEKAAADRNEPVPACDSARGVLYICDRRACERCSPECNHTADIRHAKSFELSGVMMVEQEG